MVAGGKFSLCYLLVLTIPSYQLIFDQLSCHIGDEEDGVAVTDDESCLEGQSLPKFLLSILFFCMLTLVTWLLSNNLQTSIPFDKSYLNRPNKNNVVEDVFRPMICSLLHVINKTPTKLTNIFLLALISIYFIIHDIFKVSSFDESTKQILFRIRIFFGWFFLSAPLFYVVVHH